MQNRFFLLLFHKNNIFRSFLYLSESKKIFIFVHILYITAGKVKYINLN